MSLNRQQTRYLCDKSFFHFVKTFSGPKSGKDATRSIHKPLCDFWQDETLKRKAIFLPRGWFKSTIFTKWGSIWKYLQDNESRVLIASENEKNAKRFLDFIQNQIRRNEFLRKIYPELRVIDNSWVKQNRWSSTQVDMPRKEIYSEATFTAIGVGGAAQSGHYSDIAIDDLVGEKAKESLTIMETIFNWHDNAKELLENPNFKDPNGSYITIIGTHWSPADYGCYVQKNFPEYRWMITPCLKDNDLKDEEHIKWLQNGNINQGESNWPESPKYTTEHYQNMQTKPEEQALFWSQHMNNPQKSIGLTKFDPAWLRYFRFEKRDKGLYLICQDDNDKDTEEVFPLSEIKLYGVIDPGAFAETKALRRGSRNAFLIGGQARDSIKKFVVYTEANRVREPEKFIDIIFEANEKWKPRKWEIETVAAQNYIYRDIKEARRRRGTHISISPLDRDVSKDVKNAEIQALINPFFNGEIYIHRDMKDFIIEYGNYPGGLTNDLIDCLGKLFRYHMSRKERRTDTRPRHAMDDTQAGRSVVGGY